MDHSRKEGESLAFELAMHQQPETHIPTFPGMLPVTKYQPQQQILLENPSKAARSGAVLPPHCLQRGAEPS